MRPAMKIIFKLSPRAEMSGHPCSYQPNLYYILVDRGPIYSRNIELKSMKFRKSIFNTNVHRLIRRQKYLSNVQTGQLISILDD